MRMRGPGSAQRLMTLRPTVSMPPMQPWLTWLAFAAAAYLVGSVPFGWLLARSRGIDIRQHGSGNIGASNVGRVLGRKLGVACFLLDVAKGAAPVVAYGFQSGAITGDVGGAGGATRWVLIAAAAMAGHVFPVWLGFKGGKGVATGLGVTLALWPGVTLAGLASAGLWLIVTQLTGYVSVGSLAAAVALPPLTALTAWAFGLAAGEIAVFAAVTAALGLLVIARHRTNLTRLRAGNETRAAWTWKANRNKPSTPPSHD